MGVTPNFSFPYPELSDAPDGPSQISALAGAVDTELAALAPVVARYYGLADTTETAVTAASAEALSSVYTIPAAEATAGSAYELCCGGFGTWGSTQQALTLAMTLNGTSFGSGGAGHVAAGALAASAAFFWSAKITLISADGASTWVCRLDATVAQGANSANPGTAADNTIPLTVTLDHTAAVSSPVTVALGALWASTTGAPTLTCTMTTFRKIA